ncbi:MAG TPA: AraC family transcriptional regulator [Firmicutes bacterium]|nr:AraC family transcriptional regulator [Bacillota bacterium]
MSKLPKRRGGMPYDSLIPFVIDRAQRDSLVMEPHCHDSLEIFYVYSGKVSYFISERCYEIGSGEVVVMNPKDIHWINPERTEYHDRLIVLFSIDLISGLDDMQYRRLLSPFYDRPKTFFHLRKLGAYREAFEKTCDLLMFAYQHEDEHRPLRIQALMVHLLTLLYECYRAEGPRAHAFSDCVAQAIRLVNENYCYEVGLTDAAKALHISKYHLSRTFRAETGINFSDYLIYRRMQVAKQLLADEESTIADVARAVGLTPTYFSRLFRRVVHMSPSQYRNKVQKEGNIFIDATLENR